MEIRISDELKDSGLIIGHLVIENLENKKNPNKGMEKLLKSLRNNVKENPDSFLNKDELKAYSEFINSVDSVIESKNVGPNILINLILEKGYLPNISRVVDCMNIISIKSGLTISIWDKDNIKGDIIYKLTEGGERYWPFMGDEVKLLKGELAAFDDEKVLCLVRYRDSKYAPVTLETKNIVVHIQGVKGITKESVEKALNELENLLVENTGGTAIKKKIIE
ncbi:MAG: hypothetical protein KKB03_03670 [Nanoarchaeota archaeon]|nr:hypothetical protein [Nanoarchaeota archaeon]MBU1134973.1 hypothetical protein [Nanoarchaeota archaeon]MBU2520312.1 hypothetical protein [Nanoarchaeota archaeon]